jgi:hypothetical protein
MASAAMTTNGTIAAITKAATEQDSEGGDHMSDLWKGIFIGCAAATAAMVLATVIYVLWELRPRRMRRSEAS